MRKKNYSYTWRTASRFSLLVNGENYYPDILDAIINATSSIYIIQYLVCSGQITDDFITALVKAAHRGVQINIILDDYGSSSLSLSDRKTLRDAGISLVFFNPFRLKKLFQYVHRDHRKLIIIDQIVAYTGGAGICDEFDTSRDPEQGWQDVMIRMQGDIVMDWLALFFESWSKLVPASIPAIFLPAQTHKDFIHSGRINIAYRKKQEVVRSLTKHVHQAEQRIVIVTPYFVATHKIRRQLIKAARRGVEVQVIVPGPHSDHPWINQISRHYYTKLLRHNVSIYEYQPRFIHTKLVVCDNWINMGSCNLDRWNMRFNLDANIEIYDEPFSTQVHKYLAPVLQQSHPIDLHDWVSRPWNARLKEWFWSKLALWIERLTQSTRY